jgi:hypothetical protein
MHPLAKLLADLVDSCKERGYVFPLLVGVVGANGSLFCLRVLHDDDVDVQLVCRHPDSRITAALPISIYVTDKTGDTISGRIPADDPNTLHIAI